MVPSTLRCTVNGTYFGAPVANILDLLVPENYGGLSRAEACEEVAGNLLFEWSSTLLPGMNANYVARSVTFVDLSEVDGAVGIVTARAGQVWPKAGSVGGEGYAQNVAALVVKETVARRGERPGRWFLPPFGESETAGSFIAPTTITSFNNRLATFLEDMTTSDGGGGIVRPAVVHSTTPNVGTATPITSLTLRSRVSSQRRRNR